MQLKLEVCFQSYYMLLAFSAGATLCAVDAFLLEPQWLRVNRLKLSDSPTLRIVHFSDLHYGGNEKYLCKMVQRINALSPDLVCFTGDITEDVGYLTEALEIISKISAPLYGVPGNHDYWSGASFDQIRHCFRATGGEWLVDGEAIARKGLVRILGLSGEKMMTERESFMALPAELQRSAESEDKHPSPSDGITSSLPRQKLLLLCHYPAIADDSRLGKFDLILAGHSHGGQVRLPFFGALLTPYGSGKYQKGLYTTPAGPLYVNPGIGTFFLPVRFLCRPEITLIEM